VWCTACNLVRQVRTNFTDPRYTYTRAFERYALELCRHMTIKDVACHLNVGWDMIKGYSKTESGETILPSQTETSQTAGHR
jgi:transposase